MSDKKIRKLIGVVDEYNQIITRFRAGVNDDFHLLWLYSRDTSTADCGQRACWFCAHCFDKAVARCYNVGTCRQPKGRHKVASDKLDHELGVAVRLARQAGDVIMGFYRTSVTVDHKHGDEPVTTADRAADDLIVAGLRAAFPADGLLTEESEDDLSRLEKRRVWIVDPLDGTTEFITETGEFAVQIALTVEGQPILGVVYQPTGQHLFYALQGQGAFQIHNGQVTRLLVSTEADPASMCLVASRSHYSGFVEAARQALGIRHVNRMGSVGLKVGLVARGVCDLYLATNVAKEWDICAPHALLLEAGGMLTNLCGESMVYNKADVAECRGLVGSNGLAHAHIVKTLAPLLDQSER
jgi:3'(2'),5'-bisphosphate nucleotidase